jgi:hypothetical protein
MNRPSVQISFSFQYDVIYPGPLHPEFSDLPTDVTQAAVGSPRIAATASISHGVLTIDVPSGLSAGILPVGATLLY